MCYVETANLDGETNLKIRSAHTVTSDLVRTEDLVNLSGWVEAEPPNRHLYEFVGNIVTTAAGGGPASKTPIGPSQVLLRGARLRNTQWIHGIVVYTGHESKLLMNSTKAPLKRSTLDKETNLHIIFLFFILVLLSLISAVANEIIKNNGEDHSVYVGGQGSHSVVDNFGWQLVTFFILYNNLIPISLQVTLELVKIFQSAFINWDEKMHYVNKVTSSILS
jgi:phospholipid-transporting ATPase